VIPEQYGILPLGGVGKIMTNYQKLLNLVAIMGLQEKGKTKVTMRMIRY